MESKPFFFLKKKRKNKQENVTQVGNINNGTSALDVPNTGTHSVNRLLPQHDLSSPIVKGVCCYDFSLSDQLGVFSLYTAYQSCNGAGLGILS